MTRDTALARFRRARRAYQAATAIYERTGSTPYNPIDPTAILAEHTASRTALAAATQAYDAAIDALEQAAHDETTAVEATRHWHRAATAYTASPTLANYRALNAAHAAYTRAAYAAGYRPTQE